MKTIITTIIRVEAKPNRSILNLIAYKVFELGVLIMRLRGNVVEWDVKKTYENN